MKAALFVLCLLLACSVEAQEVAKTGTLGADLIDPRRAVSLTVWLENGEEPARRANVCDSIMIIHWLPAFDGTGVGYQISGLPGYHTQEQVERFLSAFYELDVFKPRSASAPNVILAGNNWGAGGALKPKLKELGKAHSFSLFYIGGWAFTKVSLMPEPEARLKLIQQAYKTANPP